MQDEVWRPMGSLAWGVWPSRRSMGRAQFRQHQGPRGTHPRGLRSRELHQAELRNSKLLNPQLRKVGAAFRPLNWARLFKSRHSGWQAAAPLLSDFRSHAWSGAWNSLARQWVCLVFWNPIVQAGLVSLSAFSRCFLSSERRHRFVSSFSWGSGRSAFVLADASL